MKILLITPAHLAGFKIGGPISSTNALIAGLAASGVEIDVLSTPMGHEDETSVPLNTWLATENSRVRVMYCRYYGYRHLTFSPRIAVATWRLIGKHDLLVLNSTWNFPIWVGAWIAQFQKVKYVIWPHGTLYRYTVEARSKTLKKILYGVILRRVIQKAAAVHFTTNHEAEGFREYFGFLPNFFLQPNGFDLESFKALPPKGLLLDRYPELRGRRLIVFFGRITKKKGLDILVDAFLQIREEVLGAHLVIAGPIDDLGLIRELQRRIRDSGAADRVTFTGMMQKEHRFSALVDGELFVLPSMSENFGMAVVEAMLCRIPVIVSSGVGISKAIEQAGAGEVIAPKSENLAEALRRLLKNRELRMQYAAAGEAFARENFCHLRVGVRLKNFYGHLIASPKP